MNSFYFTSDEQKEYALACLTFAQKIGLIDDSSLEAVDTKINQDGMAWDADSGDGTTYKYNYSRLNEGGCVMFCLGEAVNNTFTNNLSYDDLEGHRR